MPVEKDFEQYHITMLLREADWLFKKGRVDEAKKALAWVLNIEPGNLNANWLMKRKQ
jgi:predicted RNA polymerase sigma factor